MASPRRDLGIELDDLPNKGSIFRPDSNGGYRSKMFLGPLGSEGIGTADDGTATLNFQPKEDCALAELYGEATLATTGARVFGAVVTGVTLNTDNLFSSTDVGTYIPFSAFYHDNPNKPKWGQKLASKDKVVIAIKNISGAAIDIQAGFHVY